MVLLQRDLIALITGQQSAPSQAALPGAIPAPAPVPTHVPAPAPAPPPPPQYAAAPPRTRAPVPPASPATQPGFLPAPISPAAAAPPAMYNAAVRPAAPAQAFEMQRLAPGGATAPQAVGQLAECTYT